MSESSESALVAGMDIIANELGCTITIDQEKRVYICPTEEQCHVMIVAINDYAPEGLNPSTTPFWIKWGTPEKSVAMFPFNQNQFEV